MKYLLLFIIFILSQKNIAQKEYDNWCFGQYAGLNFLTGSPISFSNSAMLSLEGASCISDANGNLLFYTNGMSIWNKNHQLMANGTGLEGGGTSTQASLIIKKPLSANLYFVFTVENIGNGGRLCYSIVDIALAAGLGSVTVKNATLAVSMTEKLTATKHCNQQDYWIAACKHNSNEIHVYQVTSAGVNTVAIVSSVGTSNYANVPSTQNSTWGGYLRFSPSGKLLAKVIPKPLHFIEIFDFDLANGTVSNPIHISDVVAGYGCEFSPDGTKFYATGNDTIIQKNIIYQWDLCAPTYSALINSRDTIAKGTKFFGSLQLARDHKIYIAVPSQSFLPVINFPDKKGIACGYQFVGPSIGTATCQNDLNNLISSPFREKFDFSFSTNCASSDFSLILPSSCMAASYTIQSVQWNFNDPASGTMNTSTSSSPSHTFSGSGSYSVSCIIDYGCYTDTIRQLIPISLPSVSISGNFSPCVNQSTKLTVSGADNYSWSTGQQTNSIVIAPASNTVLVATGTNTTTLCQSTKTVSLTVLGCLGLQEIEKLSGIYPNPVSERLTIEGMEGQTVRVINLIGQTIFTVHITNNSRQIDVTVLPKGIYFLESEKGIRWKFAKE